VFSITEAQSRTIDSILKIITTIAIIVGGAWTLYQYSENKQAQLFTARMEVRKPLLEKRLALYFEIADTAATIVASKNPDKVSQAKERFWIIYRGSLKLADSPFLRKSMGEFAACLQNSKCDPSIEILSTHVVDDCYASTVLEWPGTPVLLSARNR
jgi:hypothetical protein